MNSTPHRSLWTFLEGVTGIERKTLSLGISVYAACVGMATFLVAAGAIWSLGWGSIRVPLAFTIVFLVPAMPLLLLLGRSLHRRQRPLLAFLVPLMLLLLPVAVGFLPFKLEEAIIITQSQAAIREAKAFRAVYGSYPLLLKHSRLPFDGEYYPNNQRETFFLRYQRVTDPGFGLSYNPSRGWWVTD